MSTTLDPRAIEREIGRIRERESNPYSSGVKTNLFNLVIFAGQEEGGASAAAPALQHLLGKRAARIITIDGEAAGPSTGAVVSGRCFPDARSRGVCFEEIRIFAEAPGMDIGAWAPLLIRDIPVYAWRLGRPTRESLAPILEAAEFIDKLIVDSSAGRSRASARESIRALGAFRPAARRSVVVADFAWRRTHALRVQAARAFDPPETRARLGEIREVSVAGLPPAEGALFFLWLASRLGWAPGQGPTLREAAT
ncbi:MAG: glucose-6-phosphate dehydrogenase assembly protein OpcA, partial [Spirochaetes bacterium]|nr:glucose-6-phosphate dehydrogenase assembly protein OpcA [Spirochaetota bacterium]